MAGGGGKLGDLPNFKSRTQGLSSTSATATSPHSTPYGISAAVSRLCPSGVPYVSAYCLLRQPSSPKTVDAVGITTAVLRW